MAVSHKTDRRSEGETLLAACCIERDRKGDREVPKRKDMTGQRFGHLTVTGKADRTENGYQVWRCRCDCGKEILVNTRRLQNKTVTDCGCIPKVTARRGNVAEDLTGRVFGHLTVLYRTENKRGRTCWMCRCDCGKEKVATAQDLKAGKVKSCGCHTHDHDHNRIDLTGRKFGRLTAVEPTGRRNNKGSVYWRCVCDCGGEAEYTEDMLVHGRYLSCGCLKKKNQKELANKLHRIDGTCIEILENRKYRRDNTSGFRGVFRMKNGHYRVDIGFKGKRFYLGTFTEYNEAVEVRLEAEKTIYKGFLDAYHKWKEMEKDKAKEDPDWGEHHPFVFEVNKEKNGFSVYSTVS